MSVTHFIHRFIPTTSPNENYTLLILHGTGGNEDDLLSIGKLFGKNINMLSPRGNVLENGMPRFFKRLSEGVFDLEDLKYRTAELAGFIKDAAATYGFDIQKVVALGYSNGANIAGSTLLTYPGLLAGAIMYRPMVPFKTDQPLNLAGLPVYMSAGQADYLVTPAEVQEWAAILTNAGAKVDLQMVEAGHNLSQKDIELSIKWYQNNFGST